jgi:hypothetical protein
MIRHRHGDEFYLFTQDDHARLSGALAAQVGNARFNKPEPFHAVIEGISMHDSGWPLHDSQPTLNGEGLPLHVFESPVEISTSVWSESVRRASEKGDYQGFLVSLHVMALSSIAQSHYAAPEKRLRNARELFELNKFQQNQIEAQENFRGRLGMRTDQALQYGLAQRGAGAAEDLLLFNYNLLKAMDRISLALLCSEPLADSIDNVYAQPGAEPIGLRLRNEGEWTLRIDPWPFGAGKVEMEVPYKKVVARRFEDVEEFRRAYVAAAVEMRNVKVVAA